MRQAGQAIEHEAQGMKHRLYKLGVFLLIGAIINITVALTCALWCNINECEVLRGAEAQAQIDYWLKPQEYFLHFKVLRTFGFGRQDILIDVESPFNAATYHGDELCVKRAGWPMLALVGYGTMDVSTCIAKDFVHVDRTWPYHLPKWLGTKPDQRREPYPGVYVLRFVPRKPLLIGFAVNTALFGGTSWMLICGPFALRRRLRQVRGSCISCGYDLRGAPHKLCPECDKPLKPRNNEIKA